MGPSVITTFTMFTIFTIFTIFDNFNNFEYFFVEICWQLIYQASSQFWNSFLRMSSLREVCKRLSQPNLTKESINLWKNVKFHPEFRKLYPQFETIILCQFYVAEKPFRIIQNLRSASLTCEKVEPCTCFPIPGFTGRMVTTLLVISYWAPRIAKL